MFYKEEDKKAYIEGEKAGYAEGLKKDKHYKLDSMHSRNVHDEMKKCCAMHKDHRSMR